MSRCALFVDAGYVMADGAMAVHGTRRPESVSWDHAGLIKLLAGVATDRTGLPVLRSYWYEAAADGRRTPEQDAVAETPGLKLRLSSARPGRREGVDVMLARDLSTLAKNGAITEAVIASSDEGLAEVVAEVQELGLRVLVLNIAPDGGGWTVPTSLRQESDDIVEISAAHLRPFVELVRGTGQPDAAASGGQRPEAYGNAQGQYGVPGGPGLYGPVNGIGQYDLAQYRPGDTGQAGNGVHGNGFGAGAPGQDGAGQNGAGQNGSAVYGVGQYGGGQYGGQNGGGQNGAATNGGGPNAPVTGANGQGGAGPNPAGPNGSGVSDFSGNGAAQGTGYPDSAFQRGNGQYQPQRVDGFAPNGAAGYPGGVGPNGDGKPIGWTVSGAPSYGMPAAGQTPGTGLDSVGRNGAMAHDQQQYLGFQPGNPAAGFEAAPIPGQPRQAYSPDSPASAAKAPGNGVLDSGPYQAGSYLGGAQQAPGGPYSQPSPYQAASPPQLSPAERPGTSFPPSGQYRAPAQLPPGGQTQSGQLERIAPAPVARPQPAPLPLPEAVKAAHAEGFGFGESVGRDAPTLWLDAVLARKPRMPSDLEARLLQGSSLPIDSLLHDEVRHSLRRGFWDALETARK